MDYRLLGRTGIQVSPFALGTDNFMDPTPAEESARILEMAMEAGINLLDTGDVYADGAGEKIIGETLKRTGRRNNRPLLKHGDPRKTLSDLMAWRYPIYGTAELIVDKNRNGNTGIVGVTFFGATQRWHDLPQPAIFN